MQSLKAIMDSVSAMWGICDYAPFAAHVLPCRAKSRIPQNAQSDRVKFFLPCLIQPREAFLIFRRFQHGKAYCQHEHPPFFCVALNCPENVSTSESIPYRAEFFKIPRNAQKT